MIGYAASLLLPLENVWVSEHRRWSPSYACAELLWYLSGVNSLDMIKHYAPSYEKRSDGFGIYGPRWSGQFGAVCDLLSRDPYSRRAVVQLWVPDDLHEQGRSDLPCTLSLQFLLRPSLHQAGVMQLHLVVTMRSNDVWLGTPYDVFAFTCIQAMVARELEVHLGHYHHRAGSLHLYDVNSAAALKTWGDRQPTASHDWWPYASFGEVGTMLVLEQQARRGLGIDLVELRELSPMAQDLVACCARHWGHDVPLNSKLLEEAYAHYRRGRPGRQDDVGAEHAETRAPA